MSSLRNDSDNVFTDISSEKEREYKFPNGDTISISQPLMISISKSGGHRIFAEGNYCYYIPPKWIAIGWKAYDEEPHFVK